MTSTRPWLAYGTAGLVALSLSAAHLRAAEPQQPSTVASAHAPAGRAGWRSAALAATMNWFS